MVTVEPIPREALIQLALGLLAATPLSILSLFLPEPARALVLPTVAAVILWRKWVKVRVNGKVDVGVGWQEEDSRKGEGRRWETSDAGAGATGGSPASTDA